MNINQLLKEAYEMI